ncbi:hypothetical protein RZS08_07085, partial [Arthrospira platensis SPKY1]|nr:hypothetical protein [Arthrospira platensis SPKY1]
IYNDIVGNLKKKTNTCRFAEFEDFVYGFLYGKTKFKSLYAKWVASGFKRGLTPTVYIIDESKDFDFDNIRLTTIGAQRRIELPKEIKVGTIYLEISTQKYAVRHKRKYHGSYQTKEEAMEKLLSLQK